MLTNLANYLNNDFPFHMFFAVQILLAEGLFVVRMKPRLRPLKIVLPVVLCYLVLAWFHPLLGHRFARVAAIFAESLLVLCLTMDIPTTNALCIGISSYAIQNLAFKVGGLATCWMTKPRDPLFYLLSGASFVVVYAVCYLMFVRRFPENGDLKLGNWKVLFLTLVTLLTVFVRSVSLPTDISLLDRLFSILSVIMVMVLIYQCMYADEMRREKEIIESLLAREESRHQLLGKTIDSINMKCHDLRYHIDTYRRAQQLDEHAAFFDEVEQEIQRYEYTFHTGNAALDSVLSEKSLYCSANHILLTTMLDVFHLRQCAGQRDSGGDGGSARKPQRQYPRQRRGGHDADCLREFLQQAAGNARGTAEDGEGHTVPRLRTALHPLYHREVRRAYEHRHKRPDVHPLTSAAASAAVCMTIYAQKETSFDTNALRVVFL